MGTTAARGSKMKRKRGEDMGTTAARGGTDEHPVKDVLFMRGLLDNAEDTLKDLKRPRKDTPHMGTTKERRKEARHQVDELKRRVSPWLEAQGIPSAFEEAASPVAVKCIRYMEQNIAKLMAELEPFCRYKVIHPCDTDDEVDYVAVPPSQGGGNW